MIGCGERERETIRPEFDRSIMIDGKQEHVAFNGHFGKNCFHPLFASTSDGDCLRARLRSGNVHSADGVVASSIRSPPAIATQ